MQEKKKRFKVSNLQLELFYIVANYSRENAKTLFMGARISTRGKQQHLVCA